MIIYEGKGTPAVTGLDGWHLGYPRRGFGILCYGVSGIDAAFVAEVVKRVGYVYMTSDGMPNPWDTLSPQLDALLAALGSQPSAPRDGLSRRAA